MILSQFPDQIPDLDDLLGVQTHTGLIQNQHLRRSQQRLGQAHPLAVTLGQVLDQTASHVRNLSHVHNLLHLLIPLRLGHFFQFRRKPQILLHCHIHIQRRQFRQITDALFSLLRFLLHVVTIYGHRALTGGQIAGDNIHSGGLPGAVGPQKSIDLPLLHLEGQMVHGGVIPIPLG